MSQKLNLSNIEILRRIGLEMGINRDPEEWDDSTLLDVRGLIRSGLREFYECADPRDGTDWSWRFLLKKFAYPANAQYSTGTVEIVNGAVELTGGSFPAFAANGYVRVGGYISFVTSVTDSTHLTLQNTGLNVDAGAEYVLGQWRHTLPDDFGELVGPIQYWHPDHKHPVGIVDESEVTLRYQVNWNTGQHTRMVAVQSPNDLTEADGLYHLAYWADMEVGSVLTGIIKANPLDRLDADDIRTGPDIIQADPVHAETMLAAILAAVEKQYNDMEGVHSKRFNELLVKSINKDRRTAGPIVILPKLGEPWKLDDNVTVTYETL